MKSPFVAAALFFALGLSTAAHAQMTPQNTPASNAPLDNNTSPTAPSNTTNRTRTDMRGANIGNNRDVLSPGTGTPVPPAHAAAERQARMDAKRAKRAAKGKMK